MKNMFSMDSKIMEVLGFLADLLFLNLLFLVCCIPVVTIGAAQSGLYNAVRVLQDKEDDSSVYKAFFRGFTSGFGNVTVLWIVFAIFDAILIYTLIISLSFEGFVSFVVPLIALVPCLVLHAVIVVFHSQFSCTIMQLFRNAWLVMLMHPLRSLAVGVLTWLPAGVFIASPYTFFQLTPLFLSVYFSVALMFGGLCMQKPFNKLIEHFYGEDEIETEEESEPETQTEE